MAVTLILIEEVGLITKYGPILKKCSVYIIFVVRKFYINKNLFRFLFIQNLYSGKILSLGLR